MDEIIIPMIIDDEELYRVYHIYLAENGIQIGSPEFKDNGIKVPGRNGELHIYEKFWGITVGTTPIKLILHGRYDEFHKLRNMFMSKYHASEHKFIIGTDLNQYWKGYSTVTVEEDPFYSTITINIKCDPYPYDVVTDEVIKYVQD